MQLLVKRLRPDAHLPSRQSDKAAGYDLCACLDEPVTLTPHEIRRIPTGIAIELPDGTAGMVYPRSGLASKFGITLINCVGVVDSDYRGELQVPVVNLSEQPFTIQNGDRIAQLVVTPILSPKLAETDALSNTARGSNGFGSTGISKQKETES